MITKHHLAVLAFASTEDCLILYIGPLIHHYSFEPVRGFLDLFLIQVIIYLFVVIFFLLYFPDCTFSCCKFYLFIFCKAP